MVAVARPARVSAVAQVHFCCRCMGGLLSLVLLVLGAGPGLLRGGSTRSVGAGGAVAPPADLRYLTMVFLLPPEPRRDWPLLVRPSWGRPLPPLLPDVPVEMLFLTTFEPLRLWLAGWACEPIGKWGFLIP